MKALSKIYYYYPVLLLALLLKQGRSLVPRSVLLLQRARRTGQTGTRPILCRLDVAKEEQPSAETEDDIQAIAAELLDSQDDDDDDEDWTPDRVKAQTRRANARVWAEKISSSTSTQQEKKSETSNAKKQQEQSPNRPSPYTDEEEEIIAAMGGKTMHKSRKREWGFLGDSTLREISTDYSVPICYIADVLCLWGVPVPIDVNDRLGDLVTGEQAFALLEAVNSLDVAALHDRYSNTNLMQFCYEWDVPLQEAFEMAMKEGWSLPFGVQTCLRVEQEDELLRVLGQPLVKEEDSLDDMDMD